MTPATEAPQDARQRLLDAACEVFRNEGYRVSIERIAQRAQVARQTLYNHFPGKEALFAEVVNHAIRSILVTLDGDGDVRATLLAFGAAYREKLLSPQGLAMFRTMTAEAPRFPDRRSSSSARARSPRASAWPPILNTPWREASCAATIPISPPRC